MSRKPPQVGDDGSTGPGRDATPETVEEALERARSHGRAAAREALLTVRALLDALSIAFGEVHADLPTTLAYLRAGLDGLAQRLDGDSAGGWDGVLQTLIDAVDAEIERWEQRSRTDSDARRVLRAFLTLREALWDFGVRGAAAEPTRDAEKEPRITKLRVQRS